MYRMTVLCLCLCIAAPASAQETTNLEVGTHVGVAWTFSNGETVTSFGVPGAGSFLGLAALYFSAFPHPNVMFEPQIHYQVLSSEGDSNSIFSGILQIGYLVAPRSPSSFYVAGHGGALLLSSGSSDTVGALGFGGGYRWRIGPGGALRLEVRYRRWIDEGSYSGLNEVAFALGVGAIFR